MPARSRPGWCRRCCCVSRYSPSRRALRSAAPRAHTTALVTPTALSPYRFRASNVAEVLTPSWLVPGGGRKLDGEPTRIAAASSCVGHAHRHPHSVGARYRLGAISLCRSPDGQYTTSMTRVNDGNAPRCTGYRSALHRSITHGVTAAQTPRASVRTAHPRAAGPIWDRPRAAAPTPRARRSCGATGRAARSRYRGPRPGYRSPRHQP